MLQATQTGWVTKSYGRLLTVAMSRNNVTMKINQHAVLVSTFLKGKK